MLQLLGHHGQPSQPLPSIGALTIHVTGSRAVGDDWSTVHQLAYRSCSHTIMLIHRGVAEVEVDGVWYRGAAGQVFLIPGFRHLRRRTQGFDHTWINYSCASLATDLRLSRLARPRVLPLDPGWQVGLGAAARWTDRLDQAPEGVMALIESVLLRAIGDMQGEAPQGAEHGEPDDGLVRRAARWLDQHYRSRPTLGAVAQAVGCSPNHLHTRFTTALGLSPAAYAEQQRLRDAEQLLTGTALAIQDIADRCGYADPFHFARVVRRQLGRSPRQVRSQALRSTIELPQRLPRHGQGG